jgi:hypothetical protein
VFYSQLRAERPGTRFEEENHLRKLLMGAVAVSATLALVAGVAVADPNDSEATLTVKASPTKAGKKKKPANMTVDFSLKVDKPGTTVEVIEVLAPKGVKFSGKGFKKCNFEDLIATGITGCSSGSKAGPKGTANALVGPDNAPLNFDVYPFVEDSNTFAFYLSQVQGALQSVVHGEITNKGRKLAITIPQELRQPGGLDATLTGISQTFKGKSKKNYIVSSTSCPSGGWKFGGNLKFAVRTDGLPAPADELRETKVSCKK